MYCTYCHTAFDCGLLPDPLNGTVDTSRGTTYKSLAVYTCDKGYELFGEPVRTCGAFAWNGSEPSCISKPELAYRGYAKCTRVAGMHNAAQIVSRYFRLLSKLPSPSLTVVSCGPPEDIDFGSVQGNMFLFGDTVTYVCEMGYVLRGEANRTCQTDSSWSNAAPSCEGEFLGAGTHNTPGMGVGTSDRLVTYSE